MTIEKLTVTDAIIVATVDTLTTAEVDVTGVAIWRHITEHLGSIAKATVYSTLYFLANTGVLRVRTTKPVSERGGRRKQVYKLTPTGQKFRKRLNLSAIGW